MEKLVRDKIPAIIKEKGEKCQTRTASEEEYKEFLTKKLQEEVQEYLESKEKEELADIIEVICALEDKEEIEALRKEKQEQKGSFKNKTILKL